MKTKDLYATLGVDRSADDKALKRAYRKLAKKYHPDTNQGDASAEQKFKEVTEAYDILSDPEKRKLYDRFGMAAFDGSMGDPSSWQTSGNGNPYGGGSFDSSNPYGSAFHWQGNGPDGSYREYHFTSDGDGNMDDILHEFFGGMFHGKNGKSGAGSSGGGFRNAYGPGGGFHSEYDSNGSFRNTRSSASGMSAPGRDLRADITVSFEEAAFGCDKYITIGGDRQEKLQVHIPAGIDEGQSVRLKGKGYSGQNGGAPGDLLLKVHIMEHSFYERKGQDVYTKAFIPYTTAALGGESYFQTLYGAVQCRIPPGTQSGSKIRLKNKGIVSMKDPSQKGDEYVIIQIEVPKTMSSGERTATEQLRDIQKKHGRQGKIHTA